MISQYQDSMSRARFQYYSKRLAAFGVQQGIVLKSMEDSLRRDLIQLLSKSHNKNTYIASLIGKNEKTVRNLKNKFGDKEVILKRNRAFHVAYIVHQATMKDVERWISFENIFDRYMDICPDDVEVEEKSLREVLSALVSDGMLIEQKQRYSSFYRTSENESDRGKRLLAGSNEEKCQLIQAIAGDFDSMVDAVMTNPEVVTDMKFTRFRWEGLATDQVAEINERIKVFIRDVMREYETKAEISHGDEIRSFQMVLALGAVDLQIAGEEA